MKKKSNLHYTRDITLKRVTRAHLRVSAAGQHSNVAAVTAVGHSARFDRRGN